MSQAHLVKELNEKVKYFQEQLKSHEKQLQTALRDCKHEWNEPKQEPVMLPQKFFNWTDPDWPSLLSNQFLPDKWTRVCKVCGKKETTTEVKLTVEPIFDAKPC